MIKPNQLLAASERSPEPPVSSPLSPRRLHPVSVGPSFSALSMRWSSNLHRHSWEAIWALFSCGSCWVLTFLLSRFVVLCYIRLFLRVSDRSIAWPEQENKYETMWISAAMGRATPQYSMMTSNTKTAIFIITRNFAGILLMASGPGN